MDVERTMQFILEQRAKAEVEIAEIREMVRENAAMVRENAARGARTDRRLDALTKIVQTG